MSLKDELVQACRDRYPEMSPQEIDRAFSAAWSEVEDDFADADAKGDHLQHLRREGRL